MAARPAPPDRFLPALPAALWRSRRELRYGLDVLRHGVCDGCSLGSHGLRDEVQPSIHLCRYRLDDLERWTRNALLLERLPDLAALSRLGAAELRALGRVPQPLLRRAGEDRFRAVQWADAEKLIANRLAESQRRWSLLVDSRSSTNEGYFVLRRLAEQLEARACSLVAPPGYARLQTALRSCFGQAASTCSLRDLLATDLVVVWGGRLQRHPLLGSWLKASRAAGARIVFVGDPPGRDLESCYQLFSCADAGIADFLAGVLLACSETAQLDEDFVAARVAGGEHWPQQLGRWPWQELEQGAGVSRELMQQLAQTLGSVSKAVFVADESFGGGDEDGTSVLGLLALLLGRGLVGRPGCGLLALGGGAGGQGAQDVGFELRRQADLEELSEDSLIYAVGSALFEAMEGEAGDTEALAAVPVRVHQSHYLDPSMLLGAGELTLILPMQSRYEQRGGGTATSIDRWIRFSPEVRGHPIGEARPDWQIPARIVAAIPEQFSDRWVFQDSAAVRAEMDSSVPGYLGLIELHAPGHRMQWGGHSLHEERFATADGLARLDLAQLR
jgi:predicted molibdopterin-dependent oxidoreductase YjgC